MICNKICLFLPCFGALSAPYTFCLLLLGVAYALPFQEPVAGDYQCFSSEESIFDVTAQDTGATLTINADGSYTFTTGDASENGNVQVTEDTTAELELAFQNGSNLALQPSSGSAAYEGLFVTDKQGGRYVFVFTNNTTLRCQSPGADIVAAIQQMANEQAPTTQPDTTETTTTETTTTTEQPTTPNTINADAPEPGHYTCKGYREFTDNYENYKVGDIVEIETSELWFLSIAGLDLDTLDIFANGEYSYHDDALFKTEYGVGSLGILEWPETVGRYSFHYNPDHYDPGYTSLDWLTGGLREELYNETDLGEYDWEYTRDRPSTFYSGDNGHTEIFLGQEDDVYGLDRVICTWSGPPTRPLPSEVMQATETPENYLQSENITAPTPTTGASGLNGLYVSGEGDTLYFLPNGYVYEGVYRWGFDTLASSDVCSRYWTEEANNSKAVCSTYLIQGSGIQIGERVPESQQECSWDTKIAADGINYEYVQNCELKEGYNPATDSFLPFSQNADGTLSIDEVLYFLIAPEQNLTLDGTYEYSWGSWSATVATGGTKTITFTQDGHFVYGEASYLGGVFPQGSNTDSVTVTNDRQNPNAGTYSINGYTLTLSFNTGLNINYSFFRTDEDAFRLLNYAFTRAGLE
jgi:hypothetical protein